MWEDKAVLILVSVLAALAGLGAGVLLGAWLGRIGAFELFRMILRVPVHIFTFPGELKSQWGAWQEARNRRKIERIRFRNQMKELKGKIADRRAEIKRTKAEIRRARWQFLEPR